MNRNDPAMLDLLAAEYALGTLSGRARRRFERRLDAEPFVQRRVRAWEERLVAIDFRLEPVAPSPALWPSIERRIGRPRTVPWRAVAAAIALVAGLGLGLMLWQGSQVRPPQAQAFISDPAGGSLWTVELASDGVRLAITAVGAIRHTERRSLELWALPANAAPVSLGLMPVTGSIERTLDENQRAAIKVAANVAVSDEPAGGSPTGAPTGAVLFVAAIARS